MLHYIPGDFDNNNNNNNCYFSLFLTLYDLPCIYIQVLFCMTEFPLYYVVCRKRYTNKFKFKIQKFKFK